MRRHKRPILSATIVAALFVLMPLFALSFSVSNAGATGTPPPCAAISTDWPHRSPTGELSVHGNTDCRNVAGVVFASVSTTLYDSGYYYVGDNYAAGTNYARSNVRGACVSGYYFAISTHQIQYQGNTFYVTTETSDVCVSC